MPPPGGAGAGLRLFVTSIPKSGTHLLVPVLGAATGLKGKVMEKEDVRGAGASAFLAKHPFVYGHIRCRGHVQVPSDMRIVALIRDPRDVVLSLRDYIHRLPNPRFWPLHRLLRKLTVEEQLIRLVDGVGAAGFAVAPIERHCGNMLDWRKRGGAVVRYEALLAPKGPDVLAAALGRPDLRDALATALAAQLAGRSSGTFNVGGTRWRREMPQAVVDHIHARTDIVERLGYRRDVPT